MRITALNGSARSDGNTAKLLALVENRLRTRADEAGVALTYESVLLGARDIRRCLGCRVCFDKGEALCPLRDDLLGLNARLLEADAVILASPVYVEDVSGAMKTFIDRMAFHCHRPGFAGKPVAVLSTSGTGASKRTLRTMRLALTAWGFQVAGGKRFRMGAKMAAAEARSRYTRQAERLADRLFACAQNSPAQPPFSSLTAFQVQKRYWLASGDDGTYDYRYWKSNGWLEPGRAYYAPMRIRPLRLALAKFAAWLACLFLA